MKKQHFLHGAAVLGVAGVLSKFLGAFYRIPFARIVGGEGMGLYQMAYPIYTLALAISTSGLPVALAVMISEEAAKGEHHAAKKIFRVAFVILAALGFAMTLLIYHTSSLLAIRVFHNANAFWPIRAVAPAIFLSAVVSCWRGFFQGYQNMIPTAVSQIVEQIVRVTTVLILAFYLLPYGIPYAAAGAAFGAVSGGIAAVITLAGFSLFMRVPSSIKGKTPSFTDIAKRLFVLGLPISLAGLIMPFVQGIDAVIIPGRLLAIGYSAAEASELYGQLTGMALTLVNLPVMLSVALAMGVVPAISEARALGDRLKAQATVRQALVAMFLFAVPSAVGLGILAEPICELLYKLRQAGDILAAAAPIVIAIGFYQVTSGILQGMGRMGATVTNLSIGCGIKIILTYYLVTFSNFAVKGAAYATAIGFLIAGLLNIILLVKEYSFGILKFPVLRLAFVNIILAYFCKAMLALMQTYKPLIQVSIIIIFACIVYFAFIVIFGIISPEEIKKSIARLLRR